MSNQATSTGKMLNQENRTIAVPSFGFLSAMASASVLLPYALILLLILIFTDFQKWPSIFPFFLTNTALIRVLSDRVFWKRFFPTEMDSPENINSWRLSAKNILFRDPSCIKSMLDMIIDAGVDIALVYMAYKVSSPPLWIFLAFAVSQGVGALIQGLIIHYFDRKLVRKFSMIFTALATFAALEVSGIVHYVGYANWFGLSQLDPSIAILIILIAKNLLTGTTVIGKATIAETIKIETMREFQKA